MTKSKLLLTLGLAGLGIGVLRRLGTGDHEGPVTGLGVDGRAGTAVITGGSAGIGATFARQLASQGYDLLLVARHGERLAAVAGELHGRYGVAADTLAADLAAPADTERVAARIQQMPDLSLLVNNAGFGTTGRFSRSDMARQLDMIEVHVAASVRLARAALPGMINRRRGAIVNLASLAAFIPLPGGATYSASKAYLVVFSQALQIELRGTGVRVQALCPGFTRTEFHDTPEFSADDRAAIPGFMWMPVEAVVAQSLAALRRGSVVCIPGLGNQAIAVIARTIPTSFLLRSALRFSSSRGG